MEYNIGKNEKLMTTYKIKDEIKFILTRNEVNSIYLIYSVENDKVKKLYKGENPFILEDKIKLKEMCEIL